jgi:hypothetical protein
MKQKIGDSSINELETLLNSIMRDNKITEEAICKTVGYNEGYISQCRSRGKVPAKFLNSLKGEFLPTKTIKALPVKMDLSLEELYVMQAQITAIRNEVVKQMAREQKRSVSDCMDELEQNADVILSNMLRGKL